MRVALKILGTAVAALLFATNVCAQSGAVGKTSIAIFFDDGHNQTVPLTDIARIEFKPDAMVVFKDGHHLDISSSKITRIEFNSKRFEEPLGRNHFIGKWQVGVGVGGGTFFITLEPNGEATKTLGASHGTWTVVDGEARISWDDGWHDAIRKVGSKHEKLAYEPGKTFSDSPSNVTNAKNLTAQPI